MLKIVGAPVLFSNQRDPSLKPSFCLPLLYMFILQAVVFICIPGTGDIEACQDVCLRRLSNLETASLIALDVFSFGSSIHEHVQEMKRSLASCDSDVEYGAWLILPTACVNDS